MSEYKISYVDAHVGGEPLRLVLRGPQLKGSTLLEKREYMMRHYDHIRRAVILEPRGHDDMYGAVLVDPVHPEADLGVIFIDSAYYNNMCGHGSMAIATIAVELGLVAAVEPVTEVVLETGAGLVSVGVEVRQGRAENATLQGVPSFLYRDNVLVELDRGPVEIAIAFGGNFFAIVEMDKLGLEHSREHIRDFIRYGLAIRDYVNSNIPLAHPEKTHITTVEDILFVREAAFPEETHKSLVVLGQAMVDRSPCGTGTCARMAMLHRLGRFDERDTFYHESITGAVFEGRIRALTTTGDYPAIVPQVKGRAYLVGTGTLLIDPADPLKDGFSLR